MGLLETWNLLPASITRGLSKAASHALKTPFGQGLSAFTRQASDFTHKVSETFEALDTASGGALSSLAGDVGEAAIAAIPGAGAVFQIGKKAFSAGKMVAAALKRSRAESRSNAALADGDPFRKRRRS